MSKRDSSDGAPDGTNWQFSSPYKALLQADRRAFAWEWLRRHQPYRSAWRDQRLPSTEFGLLAYEDPERATPDARPIWASEADPQVLASRPTSGRHLADDLFDIRCFADIVEVAVDENGTEHWLLSDGQWMVRLDLHDGTLLGGPILLEHHFVGFETAVPKLAALRQLGALAHRGVLPPSLRPRERRAPRWILELRTADALVAGASQQDMARIFFGRVIAETRWRSENESYRLRIRRQVRTAKKYLDAPLHGPWFQ